VGSIGAGLAILLQWQCIITVNKLIAIILGAGVALWWGYITANLAVDLPYAGAPIFGFFFAFAISFSLHIWYISNRL
jgi:hypothetical protein